MATHRGEETYERILREAELCFARYGYDATGVAEICERAGVSKGAFYHHFPSKAAVFEALLSRWLEGLDAQLRLIQERADSAPAAILHMAGMIPFIFRIAEGRLPIFLEFWSKAIREPEIWHATISHFQRYRAFFADLIRAGTAAGEFQDIDPELAAQTLISLAVGLILQGLLEPDKGDWGALTEEAVRLLLASWGWRGKDQAGSRE
ncbi:MAG: TetR/AcrR family transcriptional regulator [Anaerolineae bacterium]